MDGACFALSRFHPSNGASELRKFRVSAPPGPPATFFRKTLPTLLNNALVVRCGEFFCQSDVASGQHSGARGANPRVTQRRSAGEER